MTLSTLVDWSTGLPELVWSSICEYLVLESDALNDIVQLSATCHTLYNLLWSPTSVSFWCHLLLNSKYLSRPIIDQIIDLLRRSGGEDDNPSIHRRLFAKRRKRQACIYRASFIKQQHKIATFSRRWFRSDFATYIGPSHENIRSHIAVERSKPGVQLLLKRRPLSTGLLQLYYDRLPRTIPVQALALAYICDRRRCRVDEYDMRVISDIISEHIGVTTRMLVDYASLGLVRTYKEDINGGQWLGLIVRRPFVNLLPGRYELIACNVQIKRRCTDENEENDCTQHMKVHLLADRGKAYYLYKKNYPDCRMFRRDWFARQFDEHGENAFSVKLATLELADMSNVYLGVQFWAYRGLCFGLWIDEFQLHFVGV